MAKEYISRDEMIEQTKARIVLGAPKFNTGLEAAIEVATSLPAADVKGFSHGQYVDRFLLRDQLFTEGAILMGGVAIIGDFQTPQSCTV